MKEYVLKFAMIQESLTFVNPLNFHNPLATFTSRGCINKCEFCAVPKIEGELREVEQWDPRPIVCDNNFLATSKKHIEKAVDKLRTMPIVDFNQGLDVRLFKRWHLDQLTKLKKLKLRFAFDKISDESKLHNAIKLSKLLGINKISVYVLIGFKDTPQEARYKLEKVREWGARPDPMRYQPLDSLQKNDYIENGWTEEELKKMVRYYFRSNWTSNIPYDEFDYKEEKKGLLF